MQTLTRLIVSNGLSNRLLYDSQLARLVEGSDQRRYHLVNRAIKARELVRLRRGRYLLDESFRNHPPHPFALAQAFAPGSYVSFETALAHHGWIPEAVYTTACVTSMKKSRQVSHERYGHFSFHPLAIRQGRFLELVDRVRIQDQSMLIAEPARAMIDLVCLRKTDWQGLDWLTDGLRVDEDDLNQISSAQLRTLAETYKHRRVNDFVKSLAREIGNN